MESFSLAARIDDLRFLADAVVEACIPFLGGRHGQASRGRDRHASPHGRRTPGLPTGRPRPASSAREHFASGCSARARGAGECPRTRASPKTPRAGASATPSAHQVVAIRRAFPDARVDGQVVRIGRWTFFCAHGRLDLPRAWGGGGWHVDGSDDAMIAWTRLTEVLRDDRLRIGAVGAAP